MESFDGLNIGDTIYGNGRWEYRFPKGNKYTIAGFVVVLYHPGPQRRVTLKEDQKGAYTEPWMPDWFDREPPQKFKGRAVRD